MNQGDKVKVAVPAHLGTFTPEGKYVGPCGGVSNAGRLHEVEFSGWYGRFPESWLTLVVPVCPFEPCDVILDNHGWAWQSQWCGDQRDELHWFCAVNPFSGGLDWSEMQDRAPFKRLVTLDYLENS